MSVKHAYFFSVIQLNELCASGRNWNFHWASSLQQDNVKLKRLVQLQNASECQIRLTVSCQK